MTNLQQIINPYNMQCATQYELLAFARIYKNEDEILKLLQIEGEIKILSLSSVEIQFENKLEKIQEELKRAKSIIVSIAIGDNDNSSEYNEFIEYINTSLDKSIDIKIEFTKVEFTEYEQIKILLAGYKIKEQFRIELGFYSEMYLLTNKEYCLKKIKKMRKKLSKKLDIKVPPIHIINAHSADNLVTLIDIKKEMPIRVFEFNSSTEKEFKKFIKKLGLSIEKFYTPATPQNISLEDIILNKKEKKYD